MNYPLISEYVEAIKYSEDNFEQLKFLRPVLDEEGEPVMTGGNFAVVFKMKDNLTGKLYAVKCFMKEQEGRAEAYRLISEELEYVSSTFLTPIKYLDKELFVDTKASDETEFPVLLMDWVEGLTLDKYIREHIDDQYKLSLLTYQFSRLAMWLMPQPFAHGDLKPDNILVREDGSLVLVDYDGMYVPAMKGQKARELGSLDFRHPSRAEKDFDEHIDDFSLASILLSLKAISLQPGLLEQYGASERLLFSANDYLNLSESVVLEELRPFLKDAELASLYSIFILAATHNNLSNVSFRLFNFSKPNRFIYEKEYFSIVVTEKDLEFAWTDNFGAKYSRDWSTLLKGPDSDVVRSMVINPNDYPEDVFWLSKPVVNEKTGNTVYWCAFKNFQRGDLLYLSSNIWKNMDVINKKTVWNIISNGSCIIREARDIETGNLLMFDDNEPIMMISEMNSVTHFDWNGQKKRYYRELKEPKKYSIKAGTKRIGNFAFSGCNLLETVNIPDSVQSVGQDIFEGCDSLQTINIPYGSREKFEKLLPQYKDKLFNLSMVNMFLTEKDLEYAWTDNYGAKYSRDWSTLLKGPDSDVVKSMVVNPDFFPENEFWLSKPIVSNKTGKTVYWCAFDSFQSGDLLYLSSNIWKDIDVINENTVWTIITNGCYIIREARDIETGNWLMTDKNKPIMMISKMNSVTYSDWNGNKKSYYRELKEPKHYSIKTGTRKIDNFAFSGCKLLETVIIPDSVQSIGQDIFAGCDSLQTINIPYGSREKYEKFLPQYKHKLKELSS